MWQDDDVVALDSYLDRLNALGVGERAPFEPAALRDLALLARRLKAILIPVEPSPLFREALRARLLVAAREQVMKPRPSWPAQHKKGLLIGAAVGSALSLAGIVALLFRLRSLARPVV